MSARPAPAPKQTVLEPISCRDDLPDEVLYARLREGDDLCLRVLMDRHGRMAQVICRNIVGDPDEAMDVVQEVFFTLWRRGGWTAEGAKFSTWLHRVVINRAIDHRRRRRDAPTEDAVLATALEAHDDDRAVSAERSLEQRQAGDRLRAAVERLPNAQKQAMRLHYFEDADVPEIMARMATTESSVRSLLKRGRMALRDDLRNQKKLWTHDHDRMARPS